MDRETLNEMVKLKFGARKAGGPDVDMVKLAADASYAHEIFSAIENLPDESLVMLAMTLRDKFGLLSAMPQAPVTPPSPQTTAEKEKVQATRYLSGARS